MPGRWQLRGTGPRCGRRRTGSGTSYVLAVSGVEHGVKVDPAAGYAFMNYHDPGDHGHWLTVCERHRRWSLDGDLGEDPEPDAGRL